MHRYPARAVLRALSTSLFAGLMLLLTAGLSTAQEAPLPLPGTGTLQSRSSAIIGSTALPGQPLPYSPFNKDRIASLRPLLQWQKSDDASEYLITLKDITAGGKQELTLTASECAATCAVKFPGKLLDDHDYEWSVEASNTTGTTVSEMFSFTIEHPGRATPLLPYNAGEVTTPAITLKWTPVAKAKSYQVRMVDTKNDKEVLKAKVLAETCPNFVCSYVLTAEDQAKLKNNHEYRWEVVSKAKLGSSTSEAATFKLKLS